jgi:arsenate reductase
VSQGRFEILHNPRCSKSRATLERLRAAGVEPAITEYLSAPPTAARLRAILDALGLDDPRALMRTQEPIYAELGLAEVQAPDALLEAMTRHPILIERPIVIRDGTRAVIGRPPETVDTLLP